MKNIKKIIPAVAAAGSIGAAGVSAVVAADANGGEDHPPMVQRMAERFKLDPDEVSKVLNEERQEHRADHRAELRASLEQAVKDGKLTQAQMTQLLEKMDQLHEERQALSWQQRRDSRGSMHDNLEAWAEANGIDLEEVLPERDSGEGHGRGWRS